MNSAEEKDTVKAIGNFFQVKNKVTGTFLTPSGDYRYLEGIANGDQLKMSSFDGEHAFLFAATMNDEGVLNEEFWSGKTWHEQWTAYKGNDSLTLKKDKTTYLKPGFEKIDFQSPDLSGKLISPSDPRYKNKVLILQLFGSWCPNCMDETKFLKQWYDNNKDLNVEILGLAYETKDDYEYAKSRALKMKNKLGVDYKYVIAGTNDKTEASKSLPMLNQIIAFPTLIIIDKMGEARKIHTGFTGLGTGNHYNTFIDEFNSTIDELEKE